MHTTLSFTEQAETALAATRMAHVPVGVLQAAVAVALVAEALAGDERTRTVAGETVAALLHEMNNLCPNSSAPPVSQPRSVAPRPRPAPAGYAASYEGCLDPS